MTEATTDQDVVDVLTTDHREAQDLIQQIRTTSEAEQRRQMADSLISELVRHSVAEEMFVYPAMTKHLPNGKEAVEHDTQEHKQLERIMKDLEGVTPTDAQFDQLITQLEQVLDDHIKDEENDQFPLLREHIPHDDLVKMAQRVQAAKKIAPTRPHPDAPNNVLFHMMVGPGVGLVDRLRDRLQQHKVD
jgi:hemerythrin-like domain-containing protein